jgi:hypothetical protein
VKFRIGDTTYDAADIEDASLADLLHLEVQSQEFGRPLDMATLVDIRDRLNKLTATERKSDPDGPWLLAVTIWIARRKAGERLTFEEAIDFPMADLHFIKEPTDRPAKATAGPTKARPGSGRAAKRPANARGSAAAKASRSASTDA